jgi:hypothetical protein
VWEFVCAAALSQVRSGVEMNPDGPGVDVFETHAARCWGIECKMLQSENAGTRRDRIVEGAVQIECDTRVHAGIVSVNVTNCINHESFQRSLAGGDAFSTAADVTRTLGHAVKEVAIEMQTPSLFQRLGADKRGTRRWKCRALVFVAQTVAQGGGVLDVYTSICSLVRPPRQPADVGFVNEFVRGLDLALRPPVR